MKIYNVKDIEGFFKVIDSCQGKVELITSEGDRLNLKSKLCQYVSLTGILNSAVEIPELKKGDLVFWSGRRGSVGATIGHVGIVADVDYDRGFFYFIHANSGGGGVTVSRSDERYFLLHYKGARRIIPLDRN